ncbi:MAG: hypothetical protein DWQ37_18265 [Planctomycetota bacterium]|nr:MAG: hypothetical protein DWQ37_18265 [Planctomycetota bacterium]
MYLPTWITRALAVSLAITLLLGAASVAVACPSCQQALDADGSQGDLASGLYYSILLMMSMPFALVGAFAGLAYRAVKREQRRQAEEAASRDESAEHDG